MKSITHKFSVLFIALYFLSIPLFSYSPELNIYSHIAFMLLTGFTVFYIMLKGEFEFSKGYIFYFFMLGICVLSTFWSKAETMSSSRNVTYALMFLFVIIIVNAVDNEKDFSFLIKSVMWAGIFYFLYAVAFYGFEETLLSLSQQEGQRLGGELTHENSFGFMGAMIFLIAFYYAYIRKKPLCYIISVIPLALSLASGSRKAIIVVVAGVFILMLLKREKSSLKTIAIWVVSIIVLVFILYYVKDKFYVFKRLDRLFSFFEGNKSADMSVNMRYNMIVSGLKWFIEKPLLGYGTLQYNYLYFTNFGAFRPAHNDIIQTLVDYGLVGLFVQYGLYTYMYIMLHKLFKQKKEHSELMLTLLIVLLVSGLTTSLIYDKIAHLIIGITLAYIGINTINTVKKDEQLPEYRYIKK